MLTVDYMAARDFRERDFREILSFYERHAEYGLRYPHDEATARRAWGKDLFFIGLRLGGELVATAWIARKPSHVFLTLQDDSLVLREGGSFLDSGGWCVRKDMQQHGMFPLLTAGVLATWYTSASSSGDCPLWGRMLGVKDPSSKDPLFWAKFGEEATGLPYCKLLGLPFGEMEVRIAEAWPNRPISLSELPSGILAQSLGQTIAYLRRPEEMFTAWGLLRVPDYIVPTSLNYFIRITPQSLQGGEVGNPVDFLAAMLEKTGGIVEQ